MGYVPGEGGVKADALRGKLNFVIQDEHEVRIDKCYSAMTMQNAIIVHGKANKTKYFDPAFASPSNASWLPWLQKQLLMHDILAQTPELPFPWQPDYHLWSKEFERLSITPETILVAHSCGAGFLVRWLSEHSNVHVGKVVLIAPWIDPDRTGGTGNFF